MDKNIILKKFGLADVSTVTELKVGHINKTYLAECPEGKYILQSLNKNIFTEPQTVMYNIGLIEQAFREFPDGRVTVPHYLNCGERNFAEHNGEIWRVYEYTEERKDYPYKSFAHGLAVGTFLRIVNSADISFKKTVPKLHELGIADVPERNIHGDTKADNIIFGCRITIIDFDTSMRGCIAADYGDMIRSVTAKNISLTEIREATAGFAEGLGGLLTENEVSSLYSGIILIISELAKRYHGGSRNFPNKTTEQCLERERELNLQLAAVSRHKSEIISIINNCF